MTLFESRKPDHGQPPQSKAPGRAWGVVYLLGVLAVLAAIIYLMSFLMGD